MTPQRGIGLNVVIWLHFLGVKSVALKQQIEGIKCYSPVDAGLCQATLLPGPGQDLERLQQAEGLQADRHTV
jgi:hypothetical protein